MSKELQFDNGDYQTELCSKCQSDATIHTTDIPEKEEYLYWVECDCCDNRTKLFSTIKQAVFSWNSIQEKLDDIGL